MTSNALDLDANVAGRDLQEILLIDNHPLATAART
jgi:hypothetical protein